MDREEALKKQFAREARIGISLIGVAMTALIVVAFVKSSGRFRTDGEFVNNPQEGVAATQASGAIVDSRAPATANAIQAATQSMIDQVAPRVGDTSPTQAPPMPAPHRVDIGPIIVPGSSDPRSIAADDPNANDPTNATEATLPTARNAADSPANWTPPPALREGEPSGTMLQPWREPIAPADSRGPDSTEYPVRQAHATDAQSILNRPTPAAPFRANSPSTGELGQDRPGDGDEQDQCIEWTERDSLWSIARNNYGDGKYFRALAAYNGLDAAASARPPEGTIIRVPSFERLAEKFPQLVQRDQGKPIPSEPSAEKSAAAGMGEGRDSEYVTREGDTLFSIARDELGQASRYVEIIERNKSLLPRNITAGSKLPGGIRLRLWPE